MERVSLAAGEIVSAQADAGGVDDLLPSLQLLVKESISFRRRIAHRFARQSAPLSET
jgi:hypothetical protein